MFCARLFICAFWSPAGKGLTSWLPFVVSSVSLSLSHWYPGSGVVLDCIDSWSLHHYLLFLISAQSHAFVEIDHKIIFTTILLSSADSRRVVVSYKRKYMHEVPVNCLVKLAHENNVVRWTDRPDMTLAVDRDVKNQTNKPSKCIVVISLYCFH